MLLDVGITRDNSFPASSEQVRTGSPHGGHSQDRTVSHVVAGGISVCMSHSSSTHQRATEIRCCPPVGPTLEPLRPRAHGSLSMDATIERVRYPSFLVLSAALESRD